MPLPAPGEPVLYAFDLSGWLFRYWATMKGRCAHGFISFVQRIISEREPTHACICADLPFPTFRHDLAPDWYKAGRDDKPATFLERLRWAREMAEDVVGMRVLSLRGYEADDVLATVTTRAEAVDLPVVLMALDKDMMQLVTERVVMWDAKSAGVCTGPEQVKAKFGLEPRQIGDYLALAGDGVDGIPGVRGLGPKAAVDILSAYGDLDTALKAALDVRATGLFKENPRYRSLLRDQAEEAKLCQKLAVLVRDMPLKFTVEDLRL